MRTGFAPVVRWLMPGIATVAFIACSPDVPLTRDVEVSLSFAWQDGVQQRSPNVEVGAVPFAKAKEAIAIATIRRDATVNEAWKEKQKRQLEIEALKGEIGTMVIASAPPSPSGSGSQIRKSVEACRDTLNSLADTAVLYLEDVKKNAGADVPKERIEKFQKNLGAEELRDLALAIKSEDTPEVRKALGVAREILDREVWSGKATEKEHAMRVISEVERTLAGARPATRRNEGKPKGAADLERRIEAVVKDQMAWDDRLVMANRPLVMYTSLGDAVIRAKTDGDGKCHLILPRDERWVLFAYVGRPFAPGLSEKQQSLMIGEKEELCWILEAPGAGSARASIVLSGNNAVNPGVAPLKVETRGE